MKDPLTPEELFHASWFEHDTSMKHLMGAIRKEAVKMAGLGLKGEENALLYNILVLTAPAGDNPPEREFKIKVLDNLL